MESDKAIHIGSIRQPIFYYYLPKSKHGSVLINMPRVIFNNVAIWADSRQPARIILEDTGSYYTLYEATVCVDNVISNRYGAMSHDLSIKCTDIVRGAHKEIP